MNTPYAESVAIVGDLRFFEPYISALKNAGYDIPYVCTIEDDIDELNSTDYAVGNSFKSLVRVHANFKFIVSKRGDIFRFIENKEYSSSKNQGCKRMWKTLEEVK